MRCKQIPVMRIPTISIPRHHLPQKEKVVVVMGATGTIRSRLSIDLATCFPAEIINSDKMKVYQGLDIVTNKITEEECNGVPHHLLGVVDPESDFTTTHFTTCASLIMRSIADRGRLPIIDNGSNSFIEALVDDKMFEFPSRYEFCFLWVDVAMPVLTQLLCDRVDRMVAVGMVEEVGNMYDPNTNYSKGVRRAIGFSELDSYFRAGFSSSVDEKTHAKLLESAIEEMKINTCKRAYRKLEKIQRLRGVKKWRIHRLDATDVYDHQKTGGEADDAWVDLVTEPALVIVKSFLYR